jgi:hypothetical protein
MQRAPFFAACFAALLTTPGDAQEAAGAALWRLAATTLPVAPALATGAAAAFWNPAQRDDSARTQIALEAVQTPAAIGASGMLAAVRFRAGRVGELGVVYGRVGLSDLTRTGESPDPAGSDVPVYTYALGATWARAVSFGPGQTTVGATLAFHETRLDVSRENRWTLDVGASHSVGDDVLRIAAATHFFSALRISDPAQDTYAGAEYRIWRGPLWGDPAAFRMRYGIVFGHGFTPDHHIGLGGEFGRNGTLALDAGVVREGGYSVSSWRPVAGVRLRVGKYRVTLARDAGINDLGSAYRVGVGARLK